MKKNIVLITFEKDAKERYVHDLNDFFGSTIRVEGYSIVEGIPPKIDADLVIISLPAAARFVRPSLLKDTEIVFLTRTFLKENIKKLDKLPYGSQAVLVDYNYDTCMNIISALYEVGVNHIDFVPYFPTLNSSALDDVEVVVTAGLYQYVPANATEVIDIGWTVVDVSTIMEVATKMNIVTEELEAKAVKLASLTTPIIKSLVTTLQHSSEIRNRLNVVMDLIEDAVVVLNDKKDIVYYNSNMAALLAVNDQYLINKPFSSLVKIEKEFEKFAKKDVIKNLLIRTLRNNKSFIVSKRPIIIHGYVYGFVIISKDITEIQNLEEQLRKKMIEKGHVAKYRFEHVIGTSLHIRESIRKAKKMSTLDSTVLITGESGTGKEIFAQSIHNESKRASKPFIAINCAALPSELLESELFGYEEGAFTSAKKGGKPGLFELAHTGTLFLDEIGDISLNTQAKLLRVLQEKEVMRVGGGNIKPVDVRIIAATNQDPKLLVANNKFRKDLYYRINVFVIELPPLRERTDDIPLLIKQIFKELGEPHRQLDPQLVRKMLNHGWEGNVRELYNCIQYMSSMGGQYLTIDDLPPHFNDLPSCGTPTTEMDDIVVKGSIDNVSLSKAIKSILKVRPLGRGKLKECLEENGMYVSEYRIRNLLKEMSERGTIISERGRGGIRLNDAEG